MNASEAKKIAKEKREELREKKEIKQKEDEIKHKQHHEWCLKTYKENLTKSIDEAAKAGNNIAYVEISDNNFTCIEKLQKWLMSNGYTSDYKSCPARVGIGSDSYDYDAHYILWAQW